MSYGKNVEVNVSFGKTREVNAGGGPPGGRL